MKILYRILLNVETDPQHRQMGKWNGYQPGHKLEQAYVDHIDPMDDLGMMFEQSDSEICGHIVELVNRNHPVDYRNRSLCFGDVIVLERSHKDNVAFALEEVGFKQIEVPLGSILSENR
jgi:hypothetical protein